MKKGFVSLLAFCLLLTAWVPAAAAADAGPLLSHPQALTRTDENSTVIMTVGERVALKLGQAPPDWEVNISDENVISRVRNIATMVDVQGVYAAKAPGTAELSAQGTFPCQRANPRCMIASPLFRVTVVVQPAATAGASFAIGQAAYTVGEQSVAMPGAAFIKNDRTYVPAAALAQALGAALVQAGDVATFQPAGGGVPVSLGADSTELTVGPATVAMDTAPVWVDGSLYLPLRWVAEALGYRVGWNAETRSVTVGAQ